MKTNENFQLSTFNFQPDKRLAVVILNWNGRALMEEFLPSVVACTPGEWADVIVADNGSTDDSIEMLKTKFPTVGIIRLDKNYGFAEGYNQALKHIGHEYTVLLNSDVEVTPGWLDAPIAALDADKTIAGVACSFDRLLRHIHSGIALRGSGKQRLCEHMPSGKPIASAACSSGRFCIPIIRVSPSAGVGYRKRE